MRFSAKSLRSGLVTATVFLAAILAVFASVHAQLAGEIVVASQRVTYSLILDTDVIRWEFQVPPPDGITINGTGQRTATAETDGATYIVIAWTSDSTARLLRLGSGVGPVPPVVGPTAELTSSAETIAKGQSVTLNWTAGGTSTGATLQGSPVAMTGSQAFTPSASTTFVLVATDGTRTAVAQRIVVVTDQPPPPPPVTQPWAVIVYESSAAMTPGQTDICRGKSLQDWFVLRKFLGPDKLPSLVRIDKDAVVEGPPDKAAWINAGRTAALASGKPLPLIVWSAGPLGQPTVEPLAADSAAQQTRIEALVKGVKK